MPDHKLKCSLQAIKFPMLALLSAFLLLIPAGNVLAVDDTTKKLTEDIVFREPFTLKLRTDKDHFYEEKFDRIPYVHDGDVYLFKDDEFGLTLDIQDNAIHGIKYQPDLQKADVTLKFTQEMSDDGTAMMMLVIKNNTTETLHFDALMRVPDEKGCAETSILPVPPGLSDFESWPEPIVQLVLRNIRIAK